MRGRYAFWTAVCLTIAGCPSGETPSPSSCNTNTFVEEVGLGFDLPANAVGPDNLSTEGVVSYGWVAGDTTYVASRVEEVPESVEFNIAARTEMANLNGNVRTNADVYTDAQGRTVFGLGYIDADNFEVYEITTYVGRTAVILRMRWPVGMDDEASLTATMNATQSYCVP